MDWWSHTWSKAYSKDLGTGTPMLCHLRERGNNLLTSNWRRKSFLTDWWLLCTRAKGHVGNKERWTIYPTMHMHTITIWNNSDQHCHWLICHPFSFGTNPPVSTNAMSGYDLAHLWVKVPAILLEMQGLLAVLGRFRKLYAVSYMIRTKVFFLVLELMVELTFWLQR